MDRTASAQPRTHRAPFLSFLYQVRKRQRDSLKFNCITVISGKLKLHHRRMKVRFGSLVITAGICGILSFAFLATSLGTEYWYIIEMNPMNMTDIEDMSSHSGLWSINEGRLFHHLCPLLHAVVDKSKITGDVLF